MKRSTLISIIALIIAIIGALIACAAYFKRKKCVLCDDFEDDLFVDSDDLDYYSSEVEDDIKADDDKPADSQEANE